MQGKYCNEEMKMNRQIREPNLKFWFLKLRILILLKKIEIIDVTISLSRYFYSFSLVSTYL